MVVFVSFICKDSLQWLLFKYIYCLAVSLF